jgi:FecR protein
VQERKDAVNEQDRPQQGSEATAEEELVRGLLERAGARPPLPAEDLRAIATAARSAWESGAERAEIGRRSLPVAPRWALALAASLVVAIGLAGWSLLHRPAPAPTAIARVDAVTGLVLLRTSTESPGPLTRGDSLVVGARLSTESPSAPAGGEPPGGAATVALELAGGIDLRIDSDSRVQLLAPGVIELQRGALYVDTRGHLDAASSVEIRTPLGIARDVGTRFSVRLESSDEPALRVRVREGLVSVEHDRGRQLTRAGQELRVPRDGSPELSPVPTYGREWSWVLAAAAGLEIEGRPLRELLSWVSRETGWGIRYADAELAETAPEILLHGGLGTLRPDQAPFALLPTAGLEGRLEESVLVISRP